ncbi:unnamed protein product [Haemonchus placei]|uniref:Uncharacterized protein n=1 Tax=Haemonchus placei TaxID=6290 RepID=A0A0N4WS39_HAEPC|nr:unnamed protein product [Haemonchus placei]
MAGLCTSINSLQRDRGLEDIKLKNGQRCYRENESPWDNFNRGYASDKIVNRRDTISKDDRLPNMARGRLKCEEGLQLRPILPGNGDI